MSTDVSTSITHPPAPAQPSRNRENLQADQRFLALSCNSLQHVAPHHLQRKVQQLSQRVDTLARMLKRLEERA